MSNFFLAESYLLKGAILGDIDAIEVVCQTQEHAADAVLVREGDQSQDILIVLEGRIRVEGKEGNVLDALRPGSLIGEIAFLDGKPRTASLIADTPCKVMVIPADRLKVLMNEKPALAAILYRNMALALCQRVRKANQQIEFLQED